MERYDATDQYHAWYEHWHRYHWISGFITNKKVADLACGEGYGAALMAQFAHHVTAIDVDAPTIQKASEKYQHINNLSYAVGDVLDTAIPSGTLDAVVSFETLEHLEQHTALLKEFKRVLHEEGVLILSTPDKNVYSGSEHHNEFHLKELKEAEFKQLMAQHFDHVLYFGQQFQLGSAIQPESNMQTLDSIILAQGDENHLSSNLNQPTYWVAVASQHEASLKQFATCHGSFMNDTQNSLFKHYETQIKRLIAADHKIEALESQLQIQSKVISQLQARLGL